MNVVLADTNSIRCLGIEIIAKEVCDRMNFIRVNSEKALIETLSKEDITHVLLNIRIPSNSIRQLIQKIKKINKSAPILLLTENNERLMYNTVLKSKADGAINSDGPIEEFKHGFNNFLVKGKLMVDLKSEYLIKSKVQKQGKEVCLFDTLSDKQTAVLRHLLTGEKLTQIAKILGISHSAACTYKTRAFKKLNVTTLPEFISIISTHQTLMN